MTTYDNAISYSLSSFRGSDVNLFIDELLKLVRSHDYPIDRSQVNSWKDSFTFLQNNLPFDEIDNGISIVFEYFLPGEGGLRPDVILLSNKKVLVLEFKRMVKLNYLDAATQVNRYVNDLKNYHEITWKRELAVERFVVSTIDTTTYRSDIAEVLYASNFTSRITDSLKNDSLCDFAEEWIQSAYEPLPSLLAATSALFRVNGAIPHIRNIADTDIKDAIDVVHQIIDNDEGKKNLVFVYGVPGAGKTLVGMQTASDYSMDPKHKSVFLSGNGPLVNVLQGLLTHMDRRTARTDGASLVREMRTIRTDYNRNGIYPNNRVIIFDEAQRAWDRTNTRAIDASSYGRSEPETLLSLGDDIYREKNNITIICLIGEGQAIYKYEENGAQIWKNAIKSHRDWNVYGPNQLSNWLTGIKYNVKDSLFLDVSIRNNFIDTHKWVEDIIAADLYSAKSSFKEIAKKGFNFTILTNYDDVVKWMDEAVSVKDKSDSFACTGIFMSSKASKVDILPRNMRQANQASAYDWYTSGAETRTQYGTEFICQGLEIDKPVVVFGGDYYLQDGVWHKSDKVSNIAWSQYGAAYAYQDIFSIITNIYRVLLTRSRKTLAIYIPVRFRPELQETLSFFEQIQQEEML